MSHRTARLTIDVPSAYHKRLKTLASLMDISMKELVMISVDNFMGRKMNKVTEKAIKQSRVGKNVKKFENPEDLFQDLGI